MAHGATAGALTGNVAGTVTPLNSFIGGHAPNGSNNVKAGLCYLLFDEQFQWVSGGYDPVNGTATGGDKTHLLPNVSVPKNGYIYIYCTNESNINVYFDNIEVSHDRGPLLEETAYYPFGLEMKGISSKSSSFGDPANKKKFNGYEENKSLDLNWLESFYRTYDPQLGRFWQVDPKAIDELSPYAAMMNNPMLMTDALGDTTTYYDTDGNVLYTTKVKGYTRAFIVDNDYIDAAKSIFGNLGTLDLEQQLALDGVILALNPLMKFGDAYDLNSISQFYEENYNKYPIDKIDNVEINEKSMKNLTIDGKRASTASLKGLKCAEASFRMRLVNGIWTVDKNSIKSDNDSTGSDMGDRSVPNGHLHPNHMAINNKLIKFNFGKNKKYSQTLNPNLAPSGGNGWGRADIEIAKEQGRVSNGTMRNVLVNYSHIYLYTGSGYGIQIKRR